MKTLKALMGLFLMPFAIRPAQAAGTVAWQNVEWRLSELNGAAVHVADEHRRPTLTLSTGAKGNRASGMAGCNRFTGPYTVSGNALRLGPLAATQMACPDGMELEAAFLKALRNVDGFSAGSNVLTLKAGSTVVARFVRAGVRDGAVPKPGQVAGITGVEWRLVALNGSPVSPASGRRPTLFLDGTARRATGSTGCNRYNGRFTLKGSVLTFSALAATRMACPEGAELEAGFLKALAGARTWILRGGRLTLRDGARDVAVFERRAATDAAAG